MHKSLPEINAFILLAFVTITNLNICHFELCRSSRITFKISDKKTEESNSSKEISIGNKVWICQRAVVLKGVKIGSNVVIAANTLIEHARSRSADLESFIHEIIKVILSKTYEQELNHLLEGDNSDLKKTELAVALLNRAKMMNANE